MNPTPSSSSSSSSTNLFPPPLILQPASTSDTPADDAPPNLMPFSIDYTGPANVDGYLIPHTLGATHIVDGPLSPTTSQADVYSHFRGRRVWRNQIPLPTGWTGRVCLLQRDRARSQAQGDDRVAAASSPLGVQQAGRATSLSMASGRSIRDEEEKREREEMLRRKKRRFASAAAAARSASANGKRDLGGANKKRPAAAMVGFSMDDDEAEEEEEEEQSQGDYGQEEEDGFGQRRQQQQQQQQRMTRFEDDLHDQDGLLGPCSPATEAHEHGDDDEDDDFVPSDTAAVSPSATAGLPFSSTCSSLKPHSTFSQIHIWSPDGKLDAGDEELVKVFGEWTSINALLQSA